MDSVARSVSPVMNSDGGGNGNDEPGAFSGNPPTPKRTGSTPDAPFTHRQRTTVPDARGRDDKASARKHRVEEPGLGLMVTLTRSNIAHPGLYLCSIDHRIETSFKWGDFRALLPKLGWPRSENTEPLFQALREAGANIARIFAASNLYSRRNWVGPETRISSPCPKRYVRLAQTPWIPICLGC